MQVYPLKFVLIGDCRVGKSALSRSFMQKDFHNDLQSTVGIEFSTREISFERCAIKAQVWDTAGQERFQSMSKAYYRNSVGALLVYDITRKESFENLQNVWMPQIKEFGLNKSQLILVGNKLDMVTDNTESREISVEEASLFAREHNLDFIETSALNGVNVEIAFRRVVLSVARKLPDVAIHLELNCLPDGWISYSLPVVEQEEVGMSAPDLNDGKSSPFDAMKQRSQSLNISAIQAKKLNFHQNPILNPPNLEKSNSDNNMFSNMSFINYWTGEIVSEIPKTSAETGLLFSRVQEVSTESDTVGIENNDRKDNKEQVEMVPALKKWEKEEEESRNSDVEKLLKERDVALTERSSSAKTGISTSADPSLEKSHDVISIAENDENKKSEKSSIKKCFCTIL